VAKYNTILSDYLRAENFIRLCSKPAFRAAIPVSFLFSHNDFPRKNFFQKAIKVYLSVKRPKIGLNLYRCENNKETRKFLLILAGN